MINRSADQPDAGDPDRRESVSALLRSVRDGRREALSELFPLVYDELHELAHRQRRTWQDHETLNTTALVHEAYLKLVDRRNASWDSEAHFLAAAARAIRHILINHARDRRAQKRGGDWQRVSMDEQAIAASAAADVPWEDRVLAVEDALQRLSARSERQGLIVECRFFGGMTVDQTAHALGLSRATVVRGWNMAQAWLRTTLGEARAS
jgi:RNA polymerase sigma factor (TIGR02999 family)